MNQFKWTFIADNGRQHQVTLMHGARTGHLLVYCNTNILLIDFKVLKTSTYSFFLEEELCELIVEREADNFRYGFKINREADTPLNQRRKDQSKKHLWQSLLFMGSKLLLITMIIVGLNQYQRNKSERDLLDSLARSGQETTARILMAPASQADPGAELDVSYFYFVNGRAYSIPQSRDVLTENPSTQRLELATGLPLEIGDEFLLRYLPGDPTFSKIDYERPNPETLQKYLDRVSTTYRAEFPEDSPERCRCLAEVAYEIKGLAGLADFYHAGTPVEANVQHNRHSFLRLIRDLPFQQKAAQKCGSL